MGDSSVQLGGGSVTGTQLGQQEVVEPGMLLPRSRKRCWGQAPPGTQDIRGEGSLYATQCVFKLFFPEEF